MAEIFGGYRYFSYLCKQIREGISDPKDCFI